MQEIADKIEPGTVIEVRSRNPKAPYVVYNLENIDCANCSAKIEAKIKELPEVDDAVLTFATRQLRVYSSAGTALLPKMQEIADKIEPGTRITVREEGKRQKDVHNEKHSSDLPEILAGAGLFIAGSLLAGPMPGVSILCLSLIHIWAIPPLKRIPFLDPAPMPEKKDRGTPVSYTHLSAWIFAVNAKTRCAML